jgi:hypothetical protein
MPSRRSGFPWSWLLALLLAPVSLRAADPDPLAQALHAARSTLRVAPDGLAGGGASPLLAQARTATFILVGEDHGFADVPRFVLALDAALGAAAPRRLVVEVGPFGTQRLARAVDGDDPTALARRHPGSTPFFEWRDDLALAQRYVARSGRGALWGVDQEFIFAATPHLEALRALAPTAAHAALAPMLTRARAADRAVIEDGRPDAALLLSWRVADTQALRAAFAPAPSDEVTRRIAALAESAAIYQSNASDGHASNRRRATWMKARFMDHWRATAGGDRRAMFRLGAFHAMRGLAPTGVFDLGNLASELAASEGGHSLHLLVIAAGGTVNRKQPFLADEGLRRAPYDGRRELAVLGAEPFMDAADGDDWSLFDLAPLRRQGAVLEAAGPRFARLMHGYDFVILVPLAEAARDVVTP